MTRDDARAFCIEAMCRARRAKMGGTSFDELSEKYKDIDIEFMTFAFDALHGLARVAGRKWTEDVLTDGFIIGLFQAISAASDLMNPSETKQ